MKKSKTLEELARELRSKVPAKPTIAQTIDELEYHHNEFLKYAGKSIIEIGSTRENSYFNGVWLMEDVGYQNETISCGQILEDKILESKILFKENEVYTWSNEVYGTYSKLCSELTKELKSLYNQLETAKEKFSQVAINESYGIIKARKYNIEIFMSYNDIVATQLSRACRIKATLEKTDLRLHPSYDSSTQLSGLLIVKCEFEKIIKIFETLYHKTYIDAGHKSVENLLSIFHFPLGWPVNYRELIMESFPATSTEESKVKWLLIKRRFADFIVWMEDHQIIEKIAGSGVKQTRSLLSKIDFKQDWGKNIEESIRKTIIDRRNNLDYIREEKRNQELQDILSDFSNK